MQEILVGSAYAQVKRSLLSDAVSLARYLPITTSKKDIPLEVKVMFLYMQYAKYIRITYSNTNLVQLL